MPSWLPTLALLGILALFWLERRLIGGRATLSFTRFREAFSLGCVGATLAALLLQRIVLQFLPVDTAAWTWGPVIEELAKAAPAAILVIFFGAARWLSVADLTLLGLASGLGFEFVESNLRILASSTASVPGLSFLFDQAPDTRVNYLFSGHGTTAAFTVLGISIGFRFLWKNPLLKWLPGVVAFAIGCFDHAMDNWKVLHTDYFFGEVESIQQASKLAERIYVFTLHGALEAWLVIAGLLLASWWEGRLCARVIGDRREFLLPGETRPLVASEWMLALSRAKLGRLPFFQTLAWFRLRRSWALAVADSARFTDRSEAARRLAARLYKDKGKVVDPVPSDWVPPRKLWWPAIRRWFKRNRWVLVTRVLLVLLFLLPALLPHKALHLSNTNVFALAMIAISLLLTIPRVRAFRAQPRLDPVRMDAENAAARYHRGFLLLASLASSVVAVLNLVFSGRLLLAAQSAFISDALANWTGAGGNPGTLLGLPGLLTTTADPPGPCDDLRNEVAKGDARIQQLQGQLGGAGAFPGGGTAPMDPSQPFVTPISQQGSSGQLPDTLPGATAGQGTSAGAGGASDGGYGYLPANGIDKYVNPVGPDFFTGNFGKLPDTMPGYQPGSKAPGARPRPDPQAAADALLAEQAAQAQRRRALADCEKNAAQAPVPATTEKPAPVDISALQKALNDAKRQFEDLQRQLSTVVDADLADIQNFLQQYDQQWNKAMAPVQKFMQDYSGLANDYKNLVNQFQNRDWYLKMANIADQMLQLVAAATLEGLGAAAEQEAYLQQLGSASRTASTAGSGFTAAEGAGGGLSMGTTAGEEVEAGSAAGTGTTAASESGATAGGTGAPGATSGGAGTTAAEGEGGASSASTQKPVGQGSDTVIGGGENRPPDWETQKLGQGNAGQPASDAPQAPGLDSTEQPTRISPQTPAPSAAQADPNQMIFSTSDGKFYNAAGKEVAADGSPISPSPPVDPKAVTGDVPAQSPQGYHDGNTEVSGRSPAADAGGGAPSAGPGAGQAGQSQQMIFATSDGKYYDAYTGKEVTADGTPISQSTPAVDPKAVTGDVPADSKGP